MVEAKVQDDVCLGPDACRTFRPRTSLDVSRCFSNSPTVKSAKGWDSGKEEVKCWSQTMTHHTTQYELEMETFQKGPCAIRANHWPKLRTFPENELECCVSNPYLTLNSLHPVPSKLRKFISDRFGPTRMARGNFFAYSLATARPRNCFMSK